MARLLIKFGLESQITEPVLTAPNVIISYTREIPREDEANVAQTSIAERILALSQELEGEVELTDYAPPTRVTLRITSPQGVPLIAYPDLEPSQPGGAKTPFEIHQVIKTSEIGKIRDALTPRLPETKPLLNRNGRFVVISGGQLEFRDYKLVVNPVRSDQVPLATLNSVFGLDGFQTTTKVLSATELQDLSALQLSEVYPVPVNLQGRFEFAVPTEGNEVGWIWFLSGPLVFAGLQRETKRDNRPKTTTILLAVPPPAQSDNGEEPAQTVTSPADTPTLDPERPLNATEDDLLSNPELFNDDPGPYCQPFKNPNRIVGERAFHTILRVTQPEIGGDPSVPPADSLPPFGFSPGLSNVALLNGERTRANGPGIGRTNSVTGLTANIAALREFAGNNPVVSTKAALAERRRYVLSNSRGRAVLTTKTALEWEGDSTIYQATSLGLGHILEFRVRWRSNGYSLGNVAHTLTLAPRQTRRILTVESRILDRTTRQEITQVSDEVSQETRHDYAYSDAVQSHLGEWARGGSKSSQSGAAGGFGLALPGFVMGGGGSHGRSSSESWQNGGRSVSASEEQALRDAIRQYGESLRKLESLVVVEQSQEEFVQAVSEVVRNPNYCHSLTIIYHEILRHLRVDTEVVGARECVFVPLAIRPFTLERAIRWRDLLERSLRKRELQWVMRYLEDVNEDFASGSIPEGRRAEQPIRFLSGSIFLQLAIERPKDNLDKTLNEINWVVIAPHIYFPMRQIFARMEAAVDGQRDAIYQRENAPTIAASWINRLQLTASSGRLEGVDFTLASTYQFNRTVRVDFTYTPTTILKREDLQTLKLTLPPDASLPPSSVANVKRVEMRYYTDNFDRTVSSSNRSDDLVSVDTGKPDATGASAFIPLSEWERQNLRSIIRGAAEDLITHLNEHIEYYHKRIWWELDRDKLFMMLDSIYAVSKEDGRSVASVVERDPIGIMGNSLVYRVAGGAFLGADGHADPAALNKYYRDNAARSEPIRVSLPTSGLYTQSVMDECEACEEHAGSTDWVLSDKEPELADLNMDALASRRATLPEATPTPFPGSIINLQNAPNAPPPSGFSDILNAVQNGQAFRDMAGLAGTQANARAAMESAANLANEFGSRAVELRKAELAAKQAKEKLAVVDKASSTGAIDGEEKKQQTKRILDEMTSGSQQPPKLTQEPVIAEALSQGLPFSVTRSDGTGVQTVEVQPAKFAGDAFFAPAAPLQTQTLLGSSTYGLPDQVPDAVFIHKKPGDVFITSATKFHDQWKFKIVSIESLQDVVDSIADGRVAIDRRLRIITHAGDSLFVPLFRGAPKDEDTSKELLHAAAESDERAIAELLGKVEIDVDALTGTTPIWQHVARQLIGNANATKFGLSDTTPPKNPMRSFLQRHLERAAIAASPIITSGPKTLTQTQKDVYLEALKFLIAALRKQLIAGGAGTDTEAQQLGSDIEAEVGVGGFTLSFPFLPPTEYLAAALKQVKGNFRSQLNKARAKMIDKAVDIRGCSIGFDRDYLEGVAKLFGNPGTLPEVTAPDLFTGFPGMAFRDKILGTQADMDNEVATNPAFEAAMNDWGPLEVSGFSGAGSPAAQRKLFFDEFFKKDRILPVYKVDYASNGNFVSESLTLFRPPGKPAILNWLESQWGSDVNGRVTALTNQWLNSSTSNPVIPTIPALSIHLKSQDTKAASPQVIFVCPDQRFAGHIKKFP